MFKEFLLEEDTILRVEGCENSLHYKIYLNNRHVKTVSVLEVCCENSGCNNVLTEESIVRDALNEYGLQQTKRNMLEQELKELPELEYKDV